MDPPYIRMHARDNVAIVAIGANDGGLPARTVFPCGLRLHEPAPQGHKLSLVEISAGAAVLRYNVVIGYAQRDIPAGSWVHARILQMPQARALTGLPITTLPRSTQGSKAYTQFVKSELDGWTKVISTAGIKPE